MIKTAKKVLITGGAGFIGSHAADLLVSKGINVSVVDNLSTGNREYINKKAKFFLMDIGNLNSSYREFKGTDAIIHCAAQISVSNSIKNPINDAKVNLLDTVRLLEMCRKLDIEKFIFASSCAVYGLNPKLPISESELEIPLSPYAISKRSAELYLNYYAEAYGIKCISLRFANVYGPRQNYLGEAGVVTAFINQLLKNKAPVIFGDGQQTRDFIYVSDVANAILKALNKKTFSKKINIGTNKQTSVNELSVKIKRMMGKSSIRAIHKQKRGNEVRFSYLGIGLAKKELGWQPQISLEDGLKMTIGWFKAHNN